MRLAHVRERHAPAGAPWRLAAALDTESATWLDLEVARRRAVAANRTLEPRLPRCSGARSRRSTTISAAGLRVAALGDLVDGFAARDEDDDAVLDAGDLRVRAAGPAPAVVP